MPMYQYELKVQAAVYYKATVEQMDLPYEAWCVLRDHFLDMTGD